MSPPLRAATRRAGSVEAVAPLAGVRVLDLSRFVAGPLCAQILGDKGADVIKVERPGGEPGRHLPPFHRGESLYFAAFNRSKRGITLNLRTAAGRELLLRLVRHADVVIENFRAGTLAKMGLDYAALAAVNSRVILVSISGFGPVGPYANRPCFDEIAQCLGGLASLTGPADGPPTLAGTFLVDYVTGIYAATGALLALYQRQQSDRGQHVQVSLLDTAVSLLNTTVTQYLLTGHIPIRQGNRNRNIAPGNIYRARDGHLCIEAITQEMWERLAQLMGRPELIDDPRFREPDVRRDHALEVDRVVEAWLADQTVHEAVTRLTEASIPCAPVLDIPGLVEDEQVRSNGCIVYLAHPVLGELPLLGNPLKLPDCPDVLRHPPLLGEHNREVYRELLGLGEAELDSLREEGVI